MDTTHPSLLARLRDFADHAAWREFDARYRELILRYCQRRGLQAADAEDVRQVTVLAFARNLDRFVYRPELGRFRAYLGRIVHHAIVRHGARRNGRLEAPLPDGLEPAAPDEHDALWDEEWRLHHYRTAMRRIRETFQPQNVAVFDALLACRDVDELATEFATTRDAIYKVKQRVRERLTELIQEQIRDEELPARPPAASDPPRSRPTEL